MHRLLYNDAHIAKRMKQYERRLFHKEVLNMRLQKRVHIF